MGYIALTPTCLIISQESRKPYMSHYLEFGVNYVKEMYLSYFRVLTLKL